MINLRSHRPFLCVITSFLLVAGAAISPCQAHSTGSAAEKQATRSHKIPPRPGSFRSQFLGYSEAKKIIESFADQLPAELQGHSPAELQKLWPVYVSKRDRETRDRLAQGEEDS